MVRTRGEEIMELRCPNGTEQLIADLQRQALQTLEAMNIGIETNPTSNVRIVGFNRYLDLPDHEIFADHASYGPFIHIRQYR